MDEYYLYVTIKTKFIESSRVIIGDKTLSLSRDLFCCISKTKFKSRTSD